MRPVSFDFRTFRHLQRFAACCKMTHDAWDWPPVYRLPPGLDVQRPKATLQQACPAIPPDAGSVAHLTVKKEL